MILSQILVDNAKRFPDSVALTMRMGFRTVNLTYKEVYDISRKMALLLEKEGVLKGEKVLLLAPNSPYWICAFWGCILRGCVVVPLNIQSTSDFVEKIAKQTGARLIFAHRYYKQEIPNDVKRYDIDVIIDELDKFDPENFKEVVVDENDLVEILYTSGTTGDPKGVMLSHKNLYSNINSVSQMVSIDNGKDRWFSILPLSHILEQSIGFLLPFYCGAHIVYAHSPSAIKSLMKEYHIKKMLTVPEFLKILMSKIEGSLEKKRMKWLFDLFPRFISYLVLRQFGGKLDTVISGGAPLDAELEKKWNALGVTLLQGYGLTETSPLVTSNSYNEHRLGSVGKVAPGVQVRIADDNEIQVKGENVFGGYFKDEKRTSEVFTEDGWFKTGDMGSFDKDGFLFLKGRKKYMILGPGGQNVFPEDLEEILNSYREVKDSSVIGVEKPGGMVEVHAVLLLGEDRVAVEKIIDEVNAKLASYQQITGWSIWSEDDFPRSATKKVKKNEVLRVVLGKKDDQVVVQEKRRGPLVLLLSELTGIESFRITSETKLIQNLQIDSLMRIELIARIEDQFDLLIDETKITSKTTIADLEKMIKEKKPIKGLPVLKKWPRSPLAGVFRSIGQFKFFLFARIFIKLRVEGLEHLKDIKLPVVFMPNHISYVDPLCLSMALPKKIRKKMSFAAANDVLYGDYKHTAFLAELLFNTFPFPREEHENIKLGLDYMGKMLDGDFSVAVFPEGKMSLDGKLLPLKQGAGLVAVEMDAFVVPVKIEGSANVVPYAKFIPRRRGVVTVKFGKPLKFGRGDSYIKATEVIEEALRGL